MMRARLPSLAVLAVVFVFVFGARAIAQNPMISVSEFTPGSATTVDVTGCGPSDRIVLFVSFTGARPDGDFRLEPPFWLFPEKANGNGAHAYGPFPLPANLVNFSVWLQLADVHPSGIFWSNVVHEQWISEPIHAACLRAIAPDGMRFAEASGRTVSIYDASSLPITPPTLVASFTFLEAIHDIDWGGSGILTAGNDASLGYIRDNSGVFTQHDYGDDNHFPSTDFWSIEYVDAGTALVGGEPFRASSDYPVLFRWNYENNSVPLNFDTSNAFSQHGRISSLSKSTGTAYFAAVEAQGSESTVAVYDINSVRHRAKGTADSNFDDIDAVSISAQADWVVTAGDYTANFSVNHIWSLNGASLFKVAPLPITSSGLAASFLDGALVAVAAQGERCFVNCSSSTKPFASSNPGGACEVDTAIDAGHSWVVWSDLFECW